ncbi:hypothetical protein FA13DRAFT_1714699 [Coprinellus micaceus]|uniref:Uncharacterized protein n=1 Tax=Coprinellus micaceus TaxID=71717 RepID=A0A4Y7SR96_COPMI|nr:hypothetical protein FA13DRAFT_1714699 [Coprinellus micaceus]
MPERSYQTHRWQSKPTFGSLPLTANIHRRGQSKTASLPLHAIQPPKIDFEDYGVWHSKIPLSDPPRTVVLARTPKGFLKVIQRQVPDSEVSSNLRRCAAFIVDDPCSFEVLMGDSAATRMNRRQRANPRTLSSQSLRTCISYAPDVITTAWMAILRSNRICAEVIGKWREDKWEEQMTVKKNRKGIKEPRHGSPPSPQHRPAGGQFVGLHTLASAEARYRLRSPRARRMDRKKEIEM